MKRQENILKFLHKIPRTETPVEEATEITTDIHSSFMNNTDATSASNKSTVPTLPPADQTDATSTSDKSTVTTVSPAVQTNAISASDKSSVTTVSPAVQTDAASSLPDCWNTMQYKNFQKKCDGLIARNKKLGCDHCAKCDSMNI